MPRLHQAAEPWEPVLIDSPDDGLPCTCCGKPVLKCDRYMREVEGALCYKCAPMFMHLIDEPEGFVDADEEPLTAEQCRDWFDRHIAAGGKADDSMATEIW